MAKKKIRLIARLDVKDTNLVKGIQLEGLRKLGNPNLFAREYYEQGIAVDPAADAAALAESMTNFGFDRALYGFEREGFSAIRDAYKARCVNLGRHVTFDGGEGTAVDVDEEGRLVVQGAEGSTHVFTGEVSVHGIYGAV